LVASAVKGTVNLTERGRCRLWNVGKALDVGRSYLVGATVPLSEFQRVYKSSLNEWQRMAFEGCVADAGSHIDETSLDPSHRQARRIRRVRAATSLPQW
jgi:hypothetical protein